MRKSGSPPAFTFCCGRLFLPFRSSSCCCSASCRTSCSNRAISSEIAYNLAEQGKAIRQELGNYDGRFYSAFVRYLAQRYDVGVYILDADGNVVFPVEEDSETDFTESFDFPEKVARLMEQLASAENGEVLYEDPSGEYVYGSELIAYVGTEETQTLYLYVFKPLKLVENVTSEMNIRTMLLAIFVLVLSFAVSSAISGVLTKPITEMTQKAKQLARRGFLGGFPRQGIRQ